VTLCHVSDDINLHNYLVRSIIFSHRFSIAMRLRTLIELLVALTLTFAAVVAISKMARATCIKVEAAYAYATIGEAKTGAVCMTLNNVGREADRARFAATDAARRAV
jgi:copper(I)-binding protein